MENTTEKKIVPVEEISNAEEGLVLENFRTLGAIQRSLNENQLAFIKSTVAKGVSSQEHLFMLVYKARIIGADLLQGEMIGYTNSKGELVTITTKDFMLRRAYQTGQIERITQEPIYIREVDAENGVKVNQKCEFWETGAKLVGAYCSIKKFNSNEVQVTVPLAEYKKDNAIWKAIPETMIKKVALVQTLRLAFPNELGGVYDEDEMGYNGHIDATTEPEPILVEGGDRDADENQLKTIQVMGGDVTDIKTRQEAVDEINRLKTEQIRKKRSKK
jgi:phage recombination protein Bet